MSAWDKLADLPWPASGVLIGTDQATLGGDHSAFALFDTRTRSLVVDAMAVPPLLLGSPSSGEHFAEAMRQAVRAIDHFGDRLAAVFAGMQREAAPIARISKRRARRLRGRAKVMRRAMPWR